MDSTDQKIAIVGSGCRFPGGANSPSKLWELVREPHQLAKPIPLDRFSLSGFYHPNGEYHGHSNVREAYLLEGDGVHRKFDASFFGINRAEASVMDPQARLLMETIYEAVEAAGLSIDHLQGSDTAVYAGQMVADYEQVMLRDIDSMGTYHATGISRAFLANRVSHFFDWHGPSITIDTACSSSLVAVHQAVQQLRSGQSRVAIAAGVNLIFDPQCFAAESTLSMLSPDGRSRMWDASANGYARGEGIAAVVLKTLAAAVQDGDHIECIISETGVNQDGKTQGITMPDAASQTKLIRDCYARAGLDLSNPAHRPQFFEAHGTGTLAGDPIEAEAIASAFFPERETSVREDQQLFVGSIKTIIGHTEGTAGLAGILRASLALQKSLVPPNLLFNQLNPRVEPFYANLHLPTSKTPWPALPEDTPRRASVNSFGFGGTNAHAILESYTPEQTLHTKPSTPFAPFVFSAASEASLMSYLSNFIQYLQQQGASTDMRDLAYTLHSRRTQFPVAAAFAARTVDDLLVKLDARVQAEPSDSGPRSGVLISRKTADATSARILGLFTGQGAQWARMGFELIQESSAAREVIQNLENRLDQLPAADRPSWSLLQELQRDGSSSRINEAVISQTACTAVQILQVELLRAAGVKFSAVVGHSSGEIAAAFAAGLITAEDAICIAYYRGLYSRLAHGPDGQPGAMMAVGTTAEDAQELCDTVEFKGRACIAAVNSQASITLSGDKDAIEELQIIFEDEGKFCRRLRVDVAYHSHHLNECSDAYLRSLTQLDIRVDLESRSSLFSSVHGELMCGDYDLLKGPYWVTNMMSPVLFMQAVKSALASLGPFGAAIEIGPHPALKAPALQIIHETEDQAIPYTGLFFRGTTAIESLAEGVGLVWAQLGKGAINLHEYDKYLSGSSITRLVKGLPSYAWNHENEYWHESRYARAIRKRTGPVHELLGHITPDSTPQDMRWRHKLCPTEVSWLAGHRIQGQIVFPAAAYVVLALEAAMTLCQGHTASLIEVLDVDIGKALSFDHDETIVETIFSVTDIQRHDESSIQATFKYSAEAKTDLSQLDLLVSGKLRVTLGKSSVNALPPRLPRPPNLIKVDANEFYDAMRDLEYHWSGPFVALDRLERKLGVVTGVLNNLEKSGLLLHPAILDAAFQSALLIHSAPGDNELTKIHVPRRIRHISVNPDLCAREVANGTPLPFGSVRQSLANDPSLTSDISIYSKDSEHTMMQIEGLESFPFSSNTAEDDKELFSTLVWDVASPDAQAVAPNASGTTTQLEVVALLERMAIFYLSILDREVPTGHPSRLQGPYTHWFRYASYCIASARAGKLELWNPKWEHDTKEDLEKAIDLHAKFIDVELLRAVGENIVGIATGEISAIETSIRNDMLRRFYTHGIGAAACTKSFGRLIKQLVHRYPHMDIFEIGAGTGACTSAIIDEVGTAFSSYTFTDISTGLLSSAQNWPQFQLDQMVFKAFDVCQAPHTQGFREHSYDLVVASLVLHATPNLQETLRNVRRLLKPGGYLVAFETLPVDSTYLGVIFGAFPGWWLGVNEGRVLTPAVSLMEWDRLLRDSGFSGCDTTTPIPDTRLIPGAIFVSQAVDDRITFLRDPLSAVHNPFSPDKVIPELVIIGGQSSNTNDLVIQLETLLARHCGSVRRLNSITDVSHAGISSTSTVLSVASLDGLRLSELDCATWEALKTLLSETGSLVWLTRGRRSEDPHANAIVGLIRSAVRESPSLDYLFLDIENPHDNEASTVATAILQHKTAMQWRGQDHFHVTIEPELVLDRGRFLIPRLVTSTEMNDRYNSSRRAIMARSLTSVQNMGISGTNRGYKIEQDPLPRSDQNIGTPLRVTHSLIPAIRVADSCCLFLVFGTDCGSGERLLALSTQHSLFTYPQRGLSAIVKTPAGSEGRLLSLVAYHILAAMTLKHLFEGDKVLVHEPDPSFAAVLLCLASFRKIDVTFVTHTGAHVISANGKWLYIHPNTTDGDLSRALPSDVSAYLDFSPQDGVGSVGNRIQSHLPRLCRFENLETLFNKTAWMRSGSRMNGIRKRLNTAIAWACEALAGVNEIDVRISEVPISSLDSIGSGYDLQTVVDWTLSSELPLLVKAAASQVQFSDQKSYWLVGLSGGLGVSLCEWMIYRGARHLVISSRKPNIDESWLKGMRALGADVRVSACDITNREDVVALHADITLNMPPIAGVAQGAMVLQDTPLRNMSLEALLHVMRPKVEGSIHLNDLFQGKTLEFFIMFSSAVSMVGNHGQANYSAANLFMSSLAAKRRSRGLAASVMHIGPIFGVGYIAQQSAEGNTTFSRTNTRLGTFVGTSENDFHELFAEAVLAGSPGSTAPTELLSGIRRVGINEEKKPIWESDPLMSHFTRRPQLHKQKTVPNAQITLPIKLRLAEASTQEELTSIVQETFFAKVLALFQLDDYNSSGSSLECLHLNQLGIDSLLAVEIRSWFMKNFEVNIPVLKILDGVTVGELVALTIEKIPARLVPNLCPSPSTQNEKSQATPPARLDTTHVSQATVNGTETHDKRRLGSSKQAQDPEQNGGPCPALPAHSSIQKSFRLSWSQEMFWFAWASLNDKTSLNHTGWARLTGNLRLAALQDAVRIICQQHESLRTCFFTQGDKPFQGVMDHSALRLESQEIESEEQVSQTVKSMQEHVFDVARGSTMRLVLLSRTPTEHFLVFGVHPLAFDGTSFQIFLNDVLHCYTNPKQGKRTRQYSQFSEQQHADIAAGKFEKDLQFWRSEYATLPPPLPILSLSTATSRPPMAVHQTEQAVLWLDEKTKAQVQTVCRLYRVTPFHFYLAVFRTLLLRYASDAEDLCIGIADMNRTDDEMMEIIGLCVNLLPLRLCTKNYSTFEGVLQEARNKTYAAMANSRIPFPVLLSQLDVPRSATHTPLFQCFIDYRLGQRTRTTWGDIDLQFMDFKNMKMAYDVALDIVDDPDGDCVHTFEVHKELYGKAGAERIAKSYERLVKAFAADPRLSLDEPEMSDLTETKEVVKFGQGSSRPSYWPGTVIHRIDLVADSQRHKPAVQSGDGETVTYGDLSSHAVAIASSLQASSVGPGFPVAILQEPTHQWVSSILAIMRQGAIYVPLDLSLPWARLAAMVKDCRTGVVLVDESTRHDAHRLEAPGITVIDVSVLGRRNSASPIANSASSDSIAAILYTSGSSGIPKGIKLSHRGLCNWAEHIPHLYGLGSEVVLQQTSSAFDLSLIQILTALCHGGSLVLVPRKLRGDASSIGDIMAEHNVSFTCATPSEYSSWLDYGKQGLVRCKTWKTAFCAGESIPGPLPRKVSSLQKEGLRFYNLYGPTETSLAATGMEVPCSPAALAKFESSGPIPAGKPLPNHSIYVVDAQLRPVPAGVQGEIYIGGPGVGLGYLDKPDLTADRFVPDVFAGPDDLARGFNTLHRTGDLGRWRADGALVVEGRVGGDTQVKVRGLRIDLVEIENAIMIAADGALCEAVVSARQPDADAAPILVAHVVFNQAYRDDETERRIREMRSRLGDLPQYMHPSVILPVGSLPKTNSAKLDRKAVAELALPNGAIFTSRESSAVLTGTEASLKDIWQAVVSGQGVASSSEITPWTDFFQVGGSSLLLLSLRARIIDTFNVRTPLIRMFDNSTLATMARLIENGGAQSQQPSQSSMLTEPDGYIDWDDETKLPPSLSQLSAVKPAMSVSGPKVVVLTGATGHLGRSLLEALVSHPGVQKVHCIGVRHADSRHSILGGEKVQYHEGDLVLPSLGLSDYQAERIFCEASVIIHNGADMSYLKTYASLRPCNLQSTKELVQMSARRQVPFHFISTVSVGHLVAESMTKSASADDEQRQNGLQQQPEEFVFGPVSAAAYHPPERLPTADDSVGGAHGYIASKWASECFLERLNERYPNWPVWIHRPSLIIRRDDGSRRNPGLELVQNMRHYSSLMRAVPVVEAARLKGAFDMVELDAVVDGVVRAAIDVEVSTYDTAGVQFLHHVGGVELPLKDLHRWAAGKEVWEQKDEAIGVEVEEIDLAEWARRAGALGMHETLVAMLDDFASTQAGIAIPRVAK